MTENQHPAAEIINPHHDPRPWQDCTREDIREGDLVEHLSRNLVSIGVAHRQDENGDWYTKDGMVLTNGDRWPLRRIPAHTVEKETPMPETTTPAEPLARTLLAVPEGHGAPHHDVGRIKPDDIVMQVDESGSIRAARVHYQDMDGDWRAKNGDIITWAARRADRPDALTVWPAPTPPAVEVELPTEFGAIITNAITIGPIHHYVAPRLLRVVDSWFDDHEDSCTADHITAFTLPDGTRARRDGERADGAPRFVKVQVGEK